jgi:hypothetical protein
MNSLSGDANTLLAQYPTCNAARVFRDCRHPHHVRVKIPAREFLIILALKQVCVCGGKMACTLMLVVQRGVVIKDHTESAAAAAAVVEGRSICKQCQRMLPHAGFGTVIPAVQTVVDVALLFLG